MVGEKRREELYVSVPNLFRCPISMDVMKSPVSLCTGVTYDRSSIETWLALGHKTCPATMQTLPDTHTTPNLTLRRLIHLWLSQSEAAARNSPSISPEICKQQVANVIKGEFDSTTLTKVTGFIKSSEENSRFVAQSISRFIEFFESSNEIRISELIVEILLLISREKGVGERLNELILKRDCSRSFISVLRKGSVESKVNCAKILEMIAVLDPESQRRIAEKTELLYELYNLFTVEKESSGIEAGLSTLLAVSSSRQVKKDLIRFGLVRTIGKILTGHESAVIEKAMKMLEMIATCTEGRVAISEDGECVVGIVNRLMKCSGVATEHGVRVLWSLCCLDRDCSAQEKVVRVNGLTKVLLVMQSDCSVQTRQMCRELVKVLRTRNTKSNLAPYETKTTHISPY